MRAHQGGRIGCRPAVAAAKQKQAEAWRALLLEERLSHALIKGVDKFILVDAEEARLDKAR